MGLVILGHIVGDFYIQTDHVSERKKESGWYMLVHCLLYMLVMYIILAVLTRNLIQGLIIAVIMSSLHICVDIAKVKWGSKILKYEYVVFLLDQAIHIVILILFCFLFKIPLKMDTFSFWKSNSMSIQMVIAILIAALICWKPAAIFVSLVFRVIPRTIEDADREEEKCDKGEEVIKIGSWIGILEREIILLLGLLGQFGAIGFVLAAKSLARYKQLEKKAFAEKYLVGTLLSTLIAIGSVAICSLVN